MTKYQSNRFVHNKDPVAQRRKTRNLKRLLKWGAIGGLAILAGCGWIKSDLEFSTAKAEDYAYEYLDPAKEALVQGNKNKAKSIASTGYNRLDLTLSEHRYDIGFRSKYCNAISDSLADIAFD